MSAVSDELVQISREELRDLDELLKKELASRWSGGSSRMEMICDYALAPGGKLLRPMLLLETAGAVGGDPRQVLPAAVGAECGHVASLVHDDIIDGDNLRRGRPSVQAEFGVDDAIVVGDALLFDLFAGLADCRHTGVAPLAITQALAAVAGAGVDLCRGQSLEAELTEARSFDADAYVTMARLKTAAFFRAACESGALLGGGTPEQVRKLSRYGDRIGLAFQIKDDLLPFTSSTGVTGKPGGSDLRNARVTLPIIMAHRRSSPYDQQMIEKALFGDDHLGRRLADLGDLIRVTGALDEATEMADACLAEAQDALVRLPPNEHTARLSQIARLTVDRDR